MKRFKVICIHIGARAHYLLPKALQEKGHLHVLVTDTWVRSAFLRKLFSFLPLTMLKALAGRYDAAIPAAKVSSFGLRFLLFEFYLRSKYTYSWTLTLARDQKFEQEAVRTLTKIPDAEIVLGISYTSLLCFRAAKEKGLKTMLYQIDPGLEEENIVASFIEQENLLRTSWERAPKTYWEQWQEECRLADTIFVNSLWSKTGLVKQGVSEKKIHILPLPYQLTKAHSTFTRSYPVQFTRQRPLRCLFLGTLALRKGIHLVIEAAHALKELPIEFIFAGRSEIDASHFDASNIHYTGIVTREETANLYQQADVFLFPTFSDGFGLTQLEAMAWQLPVIASTHCGSVVQENSNGWVLQDLTAKGIESILKAVLAQPEQLQTYASGCLVRVQEFSTEAFAEGLSAIMQYDAPQRNEL